MKISILTIILLVCIVPTSNAKNVNQIRIILEDSIQCGQYQNVNGCYSNNTIQLRRSLIGRQLVFTFYHELGHFFFESTTEQEYESVFKQKKYTQEIAANYFALWIMGYQVKAVTNEMKQWFISKMLQP